MIIAEVLFWTCLGLVAYAYVGYPLVIWAAARLFGRSEDPPAVADADLPTVTLLIAAHNEAEVIRERLENALALEYPAGKLEIVVASDGSKDATAEIVRSFADRGVRLLDYHPNRGKSATLNAAWNEVRGDIVILSDANTFFDPDGPRNLARWFEDASIGAVCGRLVLIDPATGRNVDGMYWTYETFLKLCEARLDALLGANGAIYAIRRDKFVPIPSETAVDDFVIPLLSRLEWDTRLVYDASAVAREETPAEMADEFKRRARIGAGGFQSLRTLYPLLHPRHGWLAFSFLSHKIVRGCCPFFLIGAAGANMALAGDPFYRATLAAQAGFYAVAWFGSRANGRGPLVRIAKLTALFSSMNAALLVGFYRGARGRQRGAWARTART